jgi:uncharacterized protein YggE
MKAMITFEIFILLLYAVAISGRASEENGGNQPQRNVRTLKVVGSAETYVQPDICYIDLNIASSDPISASKAYTSNSNGISKIMEGFEAIGIHPADTSTTNLNMSPQYRYNQNENRQIFDGYAVSQQLSVKVRDMGSVSRILDAAIKAGATSVLSVRFTVENQSKYIDTVREEALANAKTKAEIICSKTGMKLYKPISITEDDETYEENAQLFNSKRAFAGDSAGGNHGTMPSGTMKISHRIHILYEIQ